MLEVGVFGEAYGVEKPSRKCVKNLEKKLERFKFPVKGLLTEGSLMERALSFSKVSSC